MSHYSVNDAVTLLHQLTNIFILSFRNDPSQLGELPQPFHGQHHLLNDVGGLIIGVASNVIANRPKVSDGGICPDELHSERNCFFTSS